MIDFLGHLILASGDKEGIIRIWRLCLMNDSKRNELQESSIVIHPTLNSDKVVSSVVSVLQGHDGLISHLVWGSTEEEEVPQLLSCSKTEDRSIILWEPEYNNNEEGVWFEKTRMGEVGGNREGFFTAKFGPTKDKIIATSYQGGLHLWHLKGDNWEPQSAPTGHFQEVTDIDWDVQGRFLLSVSKDQTTRLHAKVQVSNSLFL